MNTKALALIAIVSVFLAGCNGSSVKKIFRSPNPYDQYREFLLSKEFEHAAIVKDWIEAGESAFLSPVEINLPYQEITHFDKNKPQAIFIEFDAQEGHSISVEIETISNPDSNFFLDLFEVGETDFNSIQFAKDTNRLDYQVKDPGRLGIRIQPELFRGGFIRISVQQNPSLAFPIMGKNFKNIASFFGAPRDGGRRLHEGIDVFATRGTPVTSVSSGRVSRVGINNLGGKTVWVSHEGYSFYYAHLDSQMVNGGQSVKIGDTLGTVGNTGNAITTAPHLHFGIYKRGRGAINPYPFFEEKNLTQNQTLADTSNLGKNARVSVPTANLRSQPNTASTISQKLSQNEIIYLQGKTNNWYRVLLPDGRPGYLSENLITTDLSAIAILENPVGQMIRENYIDENSFDASNILEELEVIGEFQGSKLLRTESGRNYWSF
jgi:peptidoglycan LD-endopeptidase LytH